MKSYYVYILTNWTGERIYVGVTSNLEKRVWQHKNKVTEGFTKKYNIDKLVFYEVFDNPENAILREKEIKAWRREKKNKIVEVANPSWVDLAEGWFEDSSACFADVRNDMNVELLNAK